MLSGSLDSIDAREFGIGPTPIDSPAQEVKLEPGSARLPAGPVTLDLDGVWEMADGGDEAQRLAGPWPDAIPAVVPGSVHTALVAAGRIPDPKVGRNDAIAHEMSFHTWWLRRTFARPAGAHGEKLIFDGVAIRCTVWLNGERLGSHDGMFGGPEFDVAGKLKPENTLVVKLDPAPGDPKQWDNPGWRQTVVFNNVWGWHYSSIPALGIWRPARIQGSATVGLGHPFVVTHDAKAGVMDLVTNLHAAASFSGTLAGCVLPETFKGRRYHFSLQVKGGAGECPVHVRFAIPDPHIWWPNGLGKHPVYRLQLTFQPEGEGIPDRAEATFGIRTVQMAPLPGGPRPGLYNWTFVINGRPIFVKGSNWCTMDSSMDFSRARYDRYLSFAELQHIQMLRCWGSGMPETNDFYDLCDRKGIMVLQEWPTAWNSQDVQPYDVLAETIRLNTLRLRNHPSLVMWGAGNESSAPFGKAIDMMGRDAHKLDGTRPFHRAEPWGGSSHHYNCWWGREPLDNNLTMTASFWGEFGLASMPVYESVERYLPAGEKDLWPAPPDGSLAHHTPKFNTAQDLDRLLQYAGYFSACKTMGRFIVASQIAQAVGIRTTLERARTRWPECTGALYYKMNDNYPAASWSCIDWYGAPKIAQFFFRSAFAPLHACVLPDHTSVEGKSASLPVFLLDDSDALKGARWEVRVRAFDGQLAEMKSQVFRGQGSIARVKSLGVFGLNMQQSSAAPLFVVVDLFTNGVAVDRAYYFLNYEAEKDSLFNIPRTTVVLHVRDGQAVVTNEGKMPAVAVAVQRPGHADTFTATDNYLWLDTGESRAIPVNEVSGLEVGAWNADSRPGS
jgi:beta-mannosidase